MMMTAALHVKPGVRLTGLQPMMMKVLDAVPAVFARCGYDCWLTCAVEERAGGFHPTGRACDFDSSSNVPYEVGMKIRKMTARVLRADYDVVWHGPRYHLHTEFDPKETA